MILSLAAVNSFLKIYVVQTHVGQTLFALQASTELNENAQSVLAHQDTPETLLHLASEVSAKLTTNALITVLASTTNVSMLASENADQTHFVIQKPILLSAHAPLAQRAMLQSLVVSQRVTQLPDTTETWIAS